MVPELDRLSDGNEREWAILTIGHRVYDRVLTEQLHRITVVVQTAANPAIRRHDHDTIRRELGKEGICSGNDNATLRRKQHVWNCAFG